MNPMFIYAVAIAVAVVTVYGVMRASSRRDVTESDGSEESPPEIHVLTRTRMGSGRSLVVVEVEGRRLLLGSTRAQWCALADLGPAAAKPTDDLFAPFDGELARAIHATRYRKGWKHS